MAIQLSERDNLIFKYINEHHVLLEKHIAWFISCDDKPVLIRDRLRKLFYLDYLLCERHGGKLPWWTTPTKPLVYMLSPSSKQIMKAHESEVDLTSADIQRHLLEVANLRMLFLVDQKEGIICDFEWTTLAKPESIHNNVDALVKFKRDGKAVHIGIINHPISAGSELQAMVQLVIDQHKVDALWVVSRDEAHLAMLEKDLANSAYAGKVYFTTHQDVYKSGMVRSNWQSAQAVPSQKSEERANWSATLTPLQAF